MTEDDEVRLGEVVGEDFAIRSASRVEGTGFNLFLEEISVCQLDKVLEMSRESNDSRKIVELFVGLGFAVDHKSENMTGRVVDGLESEIRSGRPTEDLTEDYINELIQIRSGRMASAYALKKIRQIRDEKGIDLLENTSASEVHDFIHHALNRSCKTINNTPEYKMKMKELCDRLGISKKRKK